MSDKMDELREVAGRENFYPVLIPGVGEIPGKVSTSEAMAHYGISGFRDKTVMTFGEQAYLFAALVKDVAKSVIHVGDEPLVKKVGEMAGFDVKEAYPGRVDIVFYSGRSPSPEVMEKLRHRTNGPIFIETLPEKDPSDQIMYEMAIQRAGLVTGFLGYPGMGFDKSTKGRPALFVARRM